jgi:hypothetical protein
VNWKAGVAAKDHQAEPGEIALPAVSYFGRDKMLVIPLEEVINEHPEEPSVFN